MMENGHELMRELAVELVEQCGEAVATTLTVDAAVDSLTKSMAQTVEGDPAPLISGKSAAQLGRYRSSKPDASGVLDAIIECLRPWNEWKSVREVMNGLPDDYDDMTRNELRSVLDFYVEKGYLELEPESRRYRLHPAIGPFRDDGRPRTWRRIGERTNPAFVHTGGNSRYRLRKVRQALRVATSSSASFLLNRRGSTLKLIHGQGEIEDAEEFFRAFDEWAVEYIRTHRNPDGKTRFTVLMMADLVGVLSPEEEQIMPQRRTR